MTETTDKYTSENMEEPTATLTYKCPNCDAGLIFDAEKQSFVCKFCISEFSEQELKNTNSEKQAKEAEAEAEFSSAVNEYVCPSCGAEVIVDKSTAADFCYYCHNPVVATDRLAGAFRPSKIIPFKFDKAQAKQIFLDYCKKKWFLPRDYFAAEHSDKISGVYYPFWVTDADTHARLDTTAFRVRTWRQGDYQYTETSRFDVKRGGEIHFEDITTSALTTEDKKMLEGILPYPKNEHIDFAIPYLQGFMAKKRDIDRDMLSSEVRGKMKEYAEEMLRAEIKGYTRVETDTMNVNVLSSHWQYTLMPIWILTYKRGEKTFIYAMNGSTGKIYGELPVSPWKLALLGVIAAGVTALISFLIGGQFL